MKAKITSVWLNRAEGPTVLCGALTVPPEHVTATFIAWGQTAPKDGGYNKVDFKVTWEDGSEYEGRFDMEFGGVDGHGGFWQSLERRLEYYACVRRPSHFKDNHWKHHCENMELNGYKSSCGHILENCEIGVA